MTSANQATGYTEGHKHQQAPQKCARYCERIELKTEITQLKREISDRKWDCEVLKNKLANAHMALAVTVVFAVIGLISLSLTVFF